MDVKRVKVDKGSLFGHLDICPPDSIFHVKDAYLADKSPNKVNLGIGGEILTINGGGRDGTLIHNVMVVQHNLTANTGLRQDLVE